MGSRTLNNTLPRGLQDPVKVSVPSVSARSFGHDRGREILGEQARLPRRTATRADRQNPYDADARPVREREDVARLQRMVRLVRVCVPLTRIRPAEQVPVASVRLLQRRAYQSHLSRRTRCSLIVPNGVPRARRRATGSPAYFCDRLLACAAKGGVCGKGHEVVRPPRSLRGDNRARRARARVRRRRSRADVPALSRTPASPARRGAAPARKPARRCRPERRIRRARGSPRPRRTRGVCPFGETTMDGRAKSEGPVGHRRAPTKAKPGAPRPPASTNPDNRGFRGRVEGRSAPAPGDPRARVRRFASPTGGGVASPELPPSEREGRAPVPRGRCHPPRTAAPGRAADAGAATG